MRLFLTSITWGVAVFLPLGVSAAVIINEIAWMGTLESTANEWIELKNTASADVTLDGWTLVADDGTPSISLTGIIGGGGFFLLERTDDSTVPAVAADRIYTGALSNGGEHLQLKDADGNVVHSIASLPGWPAGDNTTKETMQWAGSSWITAPATPRAENISVVQTPPPPPEPIPPPSNPQPSTDAELASPAPEPPPAPNLVPSPPPSTVPMASPVPGTVSSEQNLPPAASAPKETLVPAQTPLAPVQQKSKDAVNNKTPSRRTSVALRDPQETQEVVPEQQQEDRDKEQAAQIINVNTLWLIGSVAAGLLIGFLILAFQSLRKPQV